MTLWCDKRIFFARMCFSDRRWRSAFEKSFFDGDRQIISPEKIRLILGVGRSGTSWLGRTLATTETPIRYCHEFLTYVAPKYFFSKKNDYTARQYCAYLPSDDPMVKMYEYTTCRTVHWEKLLPGYSGEKIRRDDVNFKIVLHKEVHSLLASEGLVKRLGCPAIFVTRNPIYNVDSLFNYQKLSSIIWRNEAAYIQSPEFLERFLPEDGYALIHALKRFPDDGVNRENVIMSKIITVAAINKMLKTIAAENKNIKHVQYERLCLSPMQNFTECAKFLQLDFENDARKMLAESLKEREEKFDPMSINRDTANQPNRKYYFLNEEEAVRAKHVLNDCGLISEID